MWGVLCYFCFVLSYYTFVVYCDDLLLLLLSCQIHILYKTSNVILLCESLVGTAIWNSFCSLSYQTLWEMLYWIVIVKLLYTLFCPAVKLYCYVRSLLYVVSSICCVIPLFRLLLWYDVELVYIYHRMKFLCILSCSDASIFCSCKNDVPCLCHVKLFLIILS